MDVLKRKDFLFFCKVSISLGAILQEVARLSIEGRELLFSASAIFLLTSVYFLAKTWGAE